MDKADTARRIHRGTGNGAKPDDGFIGGLGEGW